MSRPIKISERAYRTISYASRVYDKPMAEIVEKLLDSPLNVIGLENRQKLPLKPKRKAKSSLSNIDVIMKGVELLQDADAEIAKKCIERLNQVLGDRAPFKPSSDGEVTTQTR